VGPFCRFRPTITKTLPHVLDSPTGSWIECDDSISCMIAWELENSSSSIRCRSNRDSFLRLYNEADPMIFTVPRMRPYDWQRWRITTEASRRSFLEEDPATVT
jgi:hypothetical protein